MMQVCMDSSSSHQWLHQENKGGGGALASGHDHDHEEEEEEEEDMNSILQAACSGGALVNMDRKFVRPQHEQALKCPRCDSTHTKFCYYNNYSLSQPRYFCKTCRRYWTKGGTLRNIPVGGGCRKNKKLATSKRLSSSSSSTSSANHNHPSHDDHDPIHHSNNNTTYTTPTSDLLQLAFPHDQIHFPTLHSNGFFNRTFQNPAAFAPLDFMDDRYEPVGENGHETFHGIFSSFEMPPSLDHHHHPHALTNSMNNPSTGTVLESCQRLMLPDAPYYDDHNYNSYQIINQDPVEVKPNSSSKILSLEWHDHQQAQCNSDAGMGIIYPHGGLGVGSWTGLMNASNPLV